MKKYFEKLIKKHIKNCEYLSDIKGVKVIDIINSITIETGFTRDNGAKIHLTKYFVITKSNVKKYSYYKTTWVINVYDDINYDTTVFYNSNTLVFVK